MLAEAWRPEGELHSRKPECQGGKREVGRTQGAC